MNTKARTIVMAVALAAAASALNSQAADQSAYFEQQRQLTDGYYPPFNVVPTPARTKAATPHQIAEDNWLEAERTRGSTRSFAQVPFPVQPAAAPTATARASRPETPYQAAENDWLTKERNLTDGNFAPVQFTPAASGTAVAGAKSEPNG